MPKRSLRQPQASAAMSKKSPVENMSKGSLLQCVLKFGAAFPDMGSAYG